MIWVGLDLPRKYITAFALDEAGVVMAEHRRLPADAEALVLWLTGLGGPSPTIRAHRKLLRGRAYLVRLRTSVMKRIHGHLTAENCRTEVTDLYGKAGLAWLATVVL